MDLAGLILGGPFSVGMTFWQMGDHLVTIQEEVKAYHISYAIAGKLGSGIGSTAQELRSYDPSNKEHLRAAKDYLVAANYGLTGTVYGEMPLQLDRTWFLGRLNNAWDAIHMYSVVAWNYVFG